MRIAFLTSVVPDGRPMTGYEIANEAIVGGLKALGHDVCCIGFQLPRQGAPLSGCVVLHRANLENARAGTAEKVGFLLRAVGQGLPVSASKLRAVAPDEAAKAVHEAGPFDAVIANSYQMAAAFPALIDGQPFGYVAHNVEHLSARENATAAGSVLHRLLYARDARMLRRIESGLVKRAAWTWTLSREDAVRLGVASPDDALLPVAVPAVDVVPQDAVATFDAGLIGTWTWQPNRVGLDWFLNRVVPLLDADMRIAIAGAMPDGMKVARNVSLLGRVESAQAFLASVGVVPLVSRGGTGVQLKTIEALQSGLTCVATSSSMRGVPNPPAYCTVADEPAAFAHALKTSIMARRRGPLPVVEDEAVAFRKQQEDAMLESLERGLASLPQRTGSAAGGG